MTQSQRKVKARFGLFYIPKSSTYKDGPVKSRDHCRDPSKRKLAYYGKIMVKKDQWSILHLLSDTTYVEQSSGNRCRLDFQPSLTTIFQQESSLLVFSSLPFYCAFYRSIFICTVDREIFTGNKFCRLLRWRKLNTRKFFSAEQLEYARLSSYVLQQGCSVWILLFE